MQENMIKASINLSRIKFSCYPITDKFVSNHAVILPNENSFLKPISQERSVWKSDEQRHFIFRVGFNSAFIRISLQNNYRKPINVEKTLNNDMKLYANYREGLEEQVRFSSYSVNAVTSVKEKSFFFLSPNRS